MLIHIVIWKYRAETSAKAREEHVAKLRGLAGVVPEVRSLSVGFDVLRLPRSYDVGLVAVFEDRAGLDAYTVHPEHVAVAEMGRGISEHVASVDFEDDDHAA
ncbi:MAG: Dabb family protein [Acidobacteria bacterium]|nr:Dabb family protein [Acidobacteriota bacterium]